MRSQIEAAIFDFYRNARREDGGWSADCDEHKKCRVRFGLRGEVIGCTVGGARPIEDESRAEAANGHDRDENKAKGALALVQLAADCELFVDERGDAHAAIPLEGGGCAIRRLNSRAFKNHLIIRHYEDSGQAAGREAQENAVRLLEAKAMQAGVQRRLSERFAVELSDKLVMAIWIDLGTEDWRAVKVTADGWTVERKPPILFRRDLHVAALPEPERGGKLIEIFDFLNMKETGDRILILAWMVAAPFVHVPRDMLLLRGVQGAAKTTTAKLLRGLLDPSRAEVVSPPRDEERLIHVLSKHAVPCFDNLSTIPDWLSDGLCRAATGGALDKRSLYTDGDSVIVSYKRPIILTGINSPSDQSDFIDRTLRVELEAIPPERRRDEGSLWAEYAQARPRLFGALLDVLAQTLRQLPKTHLPKLPRMADFARIGAAAAQVLGYGEPAFLVAYEQSSERQTGEMLDVEPVAMALRAFMAERDEWTGKTAELFKALQPANPSDRPGFPKDARVLGKKLNKLRPDLAREGIDAQPATDLPEHARGWRIRRRA